MKHLTERKAIVLVYVIAAVLGGCAETPRQRYDRATLAVSGLADATRIAVSSGYVKDPSVLAALRYGLLTASNAVTKAKPFVLADQKLDATYWLDQAESALTTASTALPKGTPHGTDDPAHPASPANRP